MKHTQKPLDPSKCYFCQLAKVYRHHGWRVFIGPLTLFETSNAEKACPTCGKALAERMHRLVEIMRKG